MMSKLQEYNECTKRRRRRRDKKVDGHKDRITRGKKKRLLRETRGKEKSISGSSLGHLNCAC